MKYRNLKKVNMKLSELGLGTWAIGGPYWTDNQSTGWTGPLDEDEILSAMRLAFDAGVSHIDTADVYGYGKAERLVGRAIKSVLRETVVIATKVGWVKTSALNPFTRQNIRYQCEQSLRNLETDYIDIYYFHHCDFGPNDSFLPQAVATMDELRKEGKIRCVGISGYSESDLLRVAKVVQPAVIQSWADIEHDEFIRPDGGLRMFMDENDILFIPMMPYAQGRLLGKYSQSAPPQFEDGDNRKGSSAFSSESLRDLEPRLGALRERFGRSTADLARVALQFLLANPVVVSVIPGFRNTAQIRANIAAADKALTSAELTYIHSVFPRSEMGPHPWAS